MASEHVSSVTPRLERMRIGTHHGKFNCAEALACFMLTQLPEYKDAEIIRTKDPKVLEKCDVLVDVGGTYSHSSMRYDHYQSGFDETMNSLNPAYPWKMPLRSAGLVYFHHGHRVLAEIMGRDESDDLVKRIYPKVYEEFVQGIDTSDNPTIHIKDKYVAVNYNTVTSLTTRVIQLRPSVGDNTEAKQQEQFNKAMTLTGSEFKAKVNYFTDVWLPAMKCADEASEKQFEMFPGSRLVHLLQGAPCVDRIFTVDEVRGAEVTRKLYRIAEVPRDEWRVQIVSTKEEPHLVQSPVGVETLKKIGTHDGTFHCDEVLACFMLKQLPEYKGAHVIRTSDPVVLDTCDVVVDVGGLYDHDRKRYDHHQSGFNETMQSLDPAYPWTTPLSSAGLVYFHYGHRVLAEIMGRDESDEIVNRIFEKLYTEFVEAVDGFDNGMLPADERQRFIVTTSLADRITNLNHSWNDPYDACNVFDQFCKAMELTGSEIKNKINHLETMWLPAREIVENAFTKRFDTDKSGEVLHIDPGCTWQSHLVDLETELDIRNTIKFVIFRDGLSNQYVVQGVPKSTGSRDIRLLLPDSWRGEKEFHLQQVSGVPDSSFVKLNGCVGFGKTYDSVIKMAQMALAMAHGPN